MEFQPYEVKLKVLALAFILCSTFLTDNLSGLLLMIDVPSNASIRTYNCDSLFFGWANKMRKTNQVQNKLITNTECAAILHFPRPIVRFGSEFGFLEKSMNKMKHLAVRNELGVLTIYELLRLIWEGFEKSLASILNFFRIRWIICYKQRKLQM
jgi:hypothetical protein